MLVNYPKEYLKAIESGEIVANEKITKLYQRECAYMDNAPRSDKWKWHYDQSVANRHIEFIERFCAQSKGECGGKPLKLMLWQKAGLSLLYGWVDEYKMRRFREFALFIGRKNGKTELAAAMSHDMLINDGENGPEIVCAANAKDQAMLLFTEAANMRQQSAALRMVEKKRRTDIYSEFNFGTLKALSSKTDNMDGLNLSFVIQDEIHEQKNSAMYDVLFQSQAFRAQPIYMLISTNGFVREAFFDAKYSEYANIALWNEGFEDYTVLPLIYELDNREEWTDEEAWIKANPGLGTIKKIDTLRNHVEKAQRNPQFLPTVLTKDFNLPENSATGWLSYEEANNTEVVDMEYLRNSYAIGGCDLSATTDLTCATVIIRKPNDANTYVLQKYFIPESKMDATRGDTNNNLEAPYKLWSEQGWLKICEGATVNYHDVTEWFADLVREYNIRPLKISYDAALSGYWAEEMKEYGFEMEKIRQGAFTWTYPMKLLHGAFAEHKIIYQNNPMLKWCLLNTGVKTANAKGIESIMPVKGSSQKRIDGMVSLLNAWTGLYNDEEDYMRWIK